MAQTYTKLVYHIVFSTKNREPMIDPEWRDELHAYIGGIIRNRKGDLLRAGGIPDHMHLLVRLAASRSVSDVVRDVKCNSSLWLHDRGFEAFDWQNGYGAFTLGFESIPIVAHYIDHQIEHHRSESFQIEFLDMLVQNGVEYDEKYLWE